MSEIKFLIIGDLSGRRVKTFIECLESMNENNYKVISWMKIIEDISIFEKNLKENTIIKFEPPEKDMEIYRELLRYGENLGEIAKEKITDIDFSNYQVVAPRQWYEGFSKLLMNIKEIYMAHQNINIFCMNDFDEMCMMMDKSKTYQKLDAGLKAKEKYKFKLPKKLYTPKNHEEFRQRYGDKFESCFIKLRYGSGGTGVLAYRNNPKLNKESIHTSLNCRNVNGEKIFYSRYKVNHYTDKIIIKELIDWVLLNGAHIEKWIPKAIHNGYAYDTRAFVLNKKSNYLISRLSKSPLTNLHLKNQRLDSQEIFKNEEIKIVSQAAEDVMRIFDKSLYAGIDVVTTKTNIPYIIDVNPFGDLFHNLIGTKQNVYYFEIKSAIQKLNKVR